jgi:hypothetical protein
MPREQPAEVAAPAWIGAPRGCKRGLIAVRHHYMARDPHELMMRLAEAGAFGAVAVEDHAHHRP